MGNAGKAEVSLQLNDPDAYRVWALSTSGKRLAPVRSRTTARELIFTADVASLGEQGATLCYEVAKLSP